MKVLFCQSFYSLSSMLTSQTYTIGHAIGDKDLILRGQIWLCNIIIHIFVSIENMAGTLQNKNMSLS